MVNSLARSQGAITSKLSSGLAFLPNAAVTSGLDWDLRFKTRYSLTGYLAGSDVRGEPEAIQRIQENSRHYYQRPDFTSDELDPTRRSLTGTAGMLGISKIGGKYVRFNSNVAFKTPGFEINDLGFLRRADQRTMGNWLQIRSDTPNKWFRSRMINFNQYATWNFDGDRVFSGGNVNAHATLLNNWNFGGGYNFSALEFDDRATRGGPGVYSGGFRTVWHYLNTDPRRQLRLSYFAAGGSNGSSKGGAGKVNAVWADARSKTAAVTLRAASVAAKKVRGAPRVGKRRAASTACFIKGASDGGPLCQGQRVWIRARSKSLANIAPRLPPATSNDDAIEPQTNIARTLPEPRPIVFLDAGPGDLPDLPGSLSSPARLP